MLIYLNCLILNKVFKTSCDAFWIGIGVFVSSIEKDDQTIPNHDHCRSDYLYKIKKKLQVFVESRLTTS